MNVTSLITRCILHRPRIWGWLDARGISKETAERFRIGFDYEGLSRYTAQRVTIPIAHPWSGFDVSITARSAFSDSGPKWMHIPFPSSRMVFGPVRRTRLPYLALVEGPMDAIALEQAGVHAVAAFGVRPLSDWQIGLLLRWTTTFIVWPDNDGNRTSKGRKAAHSWAKRLREFGANVAVGPYPDDPTCDDPENLVNRRPNFVHRVIDSVTTAFHQS